MRRLRQIAGTSVRLAALTALCFGGIGLGVSSAVTTTDVQPGNAIDHSPAGCTANTLPGNDDGYTGQQDLGFNIKFGDTNYSSLYVNNNGNITFQGPQSTYTPYSLITTATPIIAPFFGDVDTAVSGSDDVTYGQVASYPWDGGMHRAYCVMWDGVAGVGYYANGDKLNKFQLLLIDRSDRGAGDFDIVFNYNQIQWETGSASGGNDGLGGNSARAGFSDGGSFNYEIPGSAVPGSFLDSNPSGLIHSSNTTQPDGSPYPGRFVFRVQNGAPPGTAGITGKVTDANSGAGLPAHVTACTLDGTSCPGSAFTASDGTYNMSGIPAGTYRVSANPDNTAYTPGAFPNTVGLTDGQVQNNVDIALTGPQPPIPGVVIGGDGYRGTNGGSSPVPVVYWQQPISLSTIGCPGGTGHYQVSDDNGVFDSGTLSDTGVTSPVNTAEDIFTNNNVPAFYPHHGNVTVRLYVDNCPSGPGVPTDSSFTMYIDPSGLVTDQNNHPIQGATVTLLRSDTGEDGTFNAVADGSSLMDPSNTHNPSTTDSQGHYGWNVQPGFYEVQATAPNCNTVTSQVYDIPPAVTNADLQLTCTQPNQDTTAPTCKIIATRMVNGQKVIDVKVTDNRGGTGVALLDNLRLVNDTWNTYVAGGLGPQLGDTLALNPAQPSVTISARKLNQSQQAIIGFDMHDAAGNVRRC